MTFFLPILLASSLTFGSDDVIIWPMSSTGTISAVFVSTGPSPSQEFGVAISTDDPTVGCCFSMKATDFMTLQGSVQDVGIRQASGVAQEDLIYWTSVTSSVTLAVDTSPPKAGVVNDLVTNAILMTIRYQEPTRNEDGTFITDLDRTEIYFEQLGVEYLIEIVPASNPTGGIVISRAFLVPVAILKDCFIKLYWRAFDQDGNMSQDSTKWGKVTNPVPCRNLP